MCLFYWICYVLWLDPLLVEVYEKHENMSYHFMLYEEITRVLQNVFENIIISDWFWLPSSL